MSAIGGVCSRKEQDRLPAGPAARRDFAASPISDLGGALALISGGAAALGGVAFAKKGIRQLG